MFPRCATAGMTARVPWSVQLLLLGEVWLWLNVDVRNPLTLKATCRVEHVAERLEADMVLLAGTECRTPWDTDHVVWKIVAKFWRIGVLTLPRALVGRFECRSLPCYRIAPFWRVCGPASVIVALSALQRLGRPVGSLTIHAETHFASAAFKVPSIRSIRCLLGAHRLLFREVRRVDVCHIVL